MINEHDITNWRVDKRIPIALLVTLFLQIGAALVWATQLDSRVGTLEHELIGTAGFTEKLARIDERTLGMKQDIESIKYAVGIAHRLTNN
jgi:hypothetical protein